MGYRIPLDIEILVAMEPGKPYRAEHVRDAIGGNIVQAMGLSRLLHKLYKRGLMEKTRDSRGVLYIRK